MAAGSTRTLWGSCSAPRTHNGRFAEGGRKEGEGRRGFEDPSQKPGYWSGTDRNAVCIEDSGGLKDRTMYYLDIHILHVKGQFSGEDNR